MTGWLGAIELVWQYLGTLLVGVGLLVVVYVLVADPLNRGPRWLP